MRRFMAWMMLSIGLLVLSGCTESKALVGVDPRQPGQIQHFTIEARDYSFSPALISVPKGTALKISLVNRGEKKHEWELQGYDVEIKPIVPGATGVIDLVTDQVGTFRFICDIDDHLEKGMRGFLIVTEPKS